MAIHEWISRGRGEALTAYDREDLTVGSATATGTGGTFVLDATKFAATGGNYASRAVVEVSGASIRFNWDGTVPTTALGHTADDDTSFTVEGWRNISAFQAVREDDTAGAADAKLIVTYERYLTS